MPAPRRESWWESWTLERVSTLPNFVALIRVSRKGPTQICLIMKPLPPVILRSMAGVTEKAEDLKCTESRWSSSSLTHHPFIPISFLPPQQVQCWIKTSSCPPCCLGLTFLLYKQATGQWHWPQSRPVGVAPTLSLLCSGSAEHLVLSAHRPSVSCPDLTL